MVRIDRRPVRRAYSSSPTASGGTSSGIAGEPHVPPRPELPLEPAQLRGKGAERRRLEARHGDRADDGQLQPIRGELTEGAAIVAEEGDELRQPPLDLGDDVITGNIGEGGGQVGQEPLEDKALRERGDRRRVGCLLPASTHLGHGVGGPAPVTATAVGDCAASR